MRTRRLRTILWIARIASALIVVFLLLMTGAYALNPMGSGNPLTATEGLGLALFPFGLCVGYEIAWLWQLTGGVISLACLGAFFAVMGMDRDLIPVVLIVAIPAVLFVVYGLLLRRQRGNVGVG